MATAGAQISVCLSLRTIHHPLGIEMTASTFLKHCVDYTGLPVLEVTLNRLLFQLLFLSPLLMVRPRGWLLFHHLLGPSRYPTTTQACQPFTLQHTVPA